MELFRKPLKKTDIRSRFSFPTGCLEYLPDFKGENTYVDLRVEDGNKKIWVFRCWKRREGHPKPVLTRGWLGFAKHYGLRTGDEIALVLENDHATGSLYRIEAKRKIVLLGKEIWADVHA